MKRLYIYIFAFLLLISFPFLAQEEKSLMVETIAYEGNHRTNAEIIERYLTIRPEQRVTRSQVEADRQRLIATHFFKDVEILISPGSAKGQANILVKVQERRWPYFQFKSGFNELEGWYISPLGLRFDNLLGYGNHFGYELLLGDRYFGARLEFVKPFIFGTEYHLSTGLSGERHTFIHFVDSVKFGQHVDFDAFEIGLSGIAKYISIGFASGNAFSDSIMTSLPKDTLTLPAPGFTQAFVTQHNRAKSFLSLNIDTRNRHNNPSSGWWGSLTFERVLIRFDEWESFQRSSLDIRGYQRVWKGVIGAARIKYGQTDENMPFYEKFYLGGRNSLRGYDEQSLTPEGYASRLFHASMEVRFPLSARLKDKSRLMGVLFFDTGDAWNTPQKFQTENLKNGLGFGIRVRIPIIGLLRFDIAAPLPEGEARGHISLGHTF